MFCSEANIAEFQLMETERLAFIVLFSDGEYVVGIIVQRELECGLSNRTRQGAGSILQSSNRLKCIRKAASPEAA